MIKIVFVFICGGEGGGQGLSPLQRLKGFFFRRESAEKVSAGVKVGGSRGGRLMDLLVYAPALTMHSGNLITPHRTSAEERGTGGGGLKPPASRTL